MRAGLCFAAAVVLLWPCICSPLSAEDAVTSGPPAEALALPDESPVELTGLLVDKVVPFPAYAVVREAADNDQRLIVLLCAPLDLRRWQTVDVRGILTTLPNGFRAVDEAVVARYTDASGIPFEVPIPVAGLEQTWPFAALPELLSVDAGRRGSSMLEETEELPTPEEPQTSEPQATEPVEGTIAWALAQPDETEAELTGKSVTAIFPDEDPPFFYIREDDLSAGIKVVPLAMPSNLQRGDRVSLVADLATDSDAERILQQGEYQYLEVTQLGYGLLPLTMGTRSLWCGPASDYTTGVEVASVEGDGLYAIGQLVRLGGKVTAVDQQGAWFYVSDGGATFRNGAITDETSNPGIRVQNAEDYEVAVGDDILIAGAAGLRTVQSDVYPVLRAIPCPSWDLVLRPEPLVIGHCDTEAQVTATLLECARPAANREIELHLTGSAIRYPEVTDGTNYATTGADGKATVTIERTGPFGYATASISGYYGTGSGTAKSAPVTIILDEWRLQIETAHFWLYEDEEFPVTARLTRLDGVPVPNHSVTLATDSGLFNGASAQYTADTDDDGEISATLVIGTCPGTGTITATTDVPPCDETVTKTKLLQVLCPNEIQHADVYLCIDTSDSMGQGTGNLAYPGVAALLAEIKGMDQLGVLETRVGGVKFSDEIVSTIGLNAQHDDVITWLATFHFSPGEDAAENSLLALATAAQQGAGAYVDFPRKSGHPKDELSKGCLRG